MVVTVPDGGHVGTPTTPQNPDPFKGKSYALEYAPGLSSTGSTCVTAYRHCSFLIHGPYTTMYSQCGPNGLTYRWGVNGYLRRRRELFVTCSSGGIEIKGRCELANVNGDFGFIVPARPLDSCTPYGWVFNNAFFYI